MAKLLVFSDTHHQTTASARIIGENKDVSAVIHAGDCTCDAEDLAAMYPDIPVHYVCGNNEFFANAPLSLILDIGGVRIFVVHGHLQRVKYEKTLSALKTAAKNAGAKLVIFGHTHVPYTEYFEDMTILNPGSARFTRTYAVAELENGKVKTEILKF